MVERALVEHGWLRTGDKGTIDPHEQLRCLVVVTKVWTVDNDLITPPFRVKRNRIEDAYARHYEHWEAANQAVIWESA